MVRALQPNFFGRGIRLQHMRQHLVDVDGLRVKLECICQWRADSVFMRSCPPPMHLRA